MMETIPVEIRRLMEAHARGLITDEECQDELAILRHRAGLLHPIPMEEAVAQMAQIARRYAWSGLSERSQDDQGAGEVGMVRAGRDGHRVCVPQEDIKGKGTG